MKKAVRNLFIILITFCVSIVYLFGCQKADNSTDGPNIMDLPNQETGMQISLDEYKKRVENIFTSSTAFHTTTYTTELASQYGYTVGEKYITKSFWKDGACYDKDGRLIWLYSNGYILEILNETSKYPINFDEEHREDYLTIYMPTVNQISDYLDFFLGLSYEEFNRSTFDENQQKYTYVNDLWTDGEGNLSDITWEFKFTQNTITIREIYKEVTLEYIYIMKDVEEVNITERIGFQDGFAFLERNDEYILIAAPVVDNLYLPQLYNGKQYKINFMALRCGRESIFVPNTVKGFVLGINEYNWIYVQKIFFAGTNDEWKVLEGVEYIRISNELITSDVK